ncbi:MAG TPA: hypothetical protein VGF84_09145 [Micromonosporaceae bacterium]
MRQAADDFLDQAIGRSHRDDAVLARTGGPAGNARLTAWTGLLLLALFLAELVTLLNLGALLSWHIVIGVVLIPPALLKTGSTGWRMVRYYRYNQPYRTAGPPPLVLRVLGPLVVLSTLAVLGSGVALILVHPSTSREDLIGGPIGVSLLDIHKLAFLLWAAATGVHTLGRLVPAVRLTVIPQLAGRVPGRMARSIILSVTVAVAAVASILALSVAGPWRTAHTTDHFRHRGHIESR